MALNVMNAFAGATTYGVKAQVLSSREFNAEEKSLINGAVVTQNDLGKSVCFSLVSGGFTYMPIHGETPKQAGEVVDMDSLTLLLVDNGKGERKWRVSVK